MSSLLEQIETLNLPKVAPPLIPPAVQDAARRLGLVLTLTSPSVPEQYEITKDGVASGFIHARRGVMSVDYPGVDDECPYEGPVDGFRGFTNHERETQLLLALSLIAAWMIRK